MTNSKPKLERNTTHELLIELNNYCPITMIIEHTKLTREQIQKAVDGEQNLEVYARLLSFWCLLTTQEEKNLPLKDAITQLEMSRAFDFSGNRQEINYSNRKGV